MEEKAANILLGITDPGYRFTIRWCGIKFRLGIKTVTTERLIKISREVSKISDVSPEDDITMFQALMEHVKDAQHISKAIAIATGTPFIKIVSHAILKLPLKDQKTLFDMIRIQSDPEVFFYTIGSAKRLSLMKKKQEQ